MNENTLEEMEEIALETARAAAKEHKCGVVVSVGWWRQSGLAIRTKQLGTSPRDVQVVQQATADVLSKLSIELGRGRESEQLEIYVRSEKDSDTDLTIMAQITQALEKYKGEGNG